MSSKTSVKTIEDEPFETPFGTVGMYIESGYRVEMSAEAIKLGHHQFEIHLEFNCVGGKWHEDPINDDEGGRFEVLDPNNKLYRRERERIQDHARRKHIPTLIQLASEWAQSHHEAIVKTGARKFRRDMEETRHELCSVAGNFESEAGLLQERAAGAVGEFMPIARDMEAAVGEIMQACAHLRAIAATMKRTRGKPATVVTIGGSHGHNGAGVPLAAAQA
jgi:hypothetical protein